MRLGISDLSLKSVEYLQELIAVNIDSQNSFLEAAEFLKSDPYNELYQVFMKLAGERAAQASELQGLVATNNEAPTECGSIVAAAHRTWMNIREAMGGGEQALLEETERAEDQIKAKYEEALSELGACACVDTLRRHFASVEASHDQIRKLRDQRALGKGHDI